MPLCPLRQAVLTLHVAALGASAVRGVPRTKQPPEPHPYVIWAESGTTVTTTAPAWEQCSGCDCMTADVSRFTLQGSIISKYTCFESTATKVLPVPDLSWNGPKDPSMCPDCQFYAITIDDLDFPNGKGDPLNHVQSMFWAANIPGDWKNLSASTVGGYPSPGWGEPVADIGELESNMVLIGRNSLGRLGLEKLCPQRGIHRYKTTVWALGSEVTDLGPDSSHAEVAASLSLRELARVTVYAELRARGSEGSSTFLQRDMA